MIEEEMSQEVLEKELEQFFQNISGIQMNNLGLIEPSVRHG